MITQEILNLAKIVWDYHHVNHKLEKSDIIMILGTNDIRAADRGIELFKEWFADKILFSGGIGRMTCWDLNFQETTEADKFAVKAMENWIPKEKILIENKSSNTWENIKFSYELIKNLNIKKIILVQTPHMERRTLATFAKQWPWNNISFYITSPQIDLENYPNAIFPMEEVINIIVWELQRIIEYPKKWFQTYQEVPENVLKAYKGLIELWFTRHLLKEI